jgi:mRNA interferase HicA
MKYSEFHRIILKNGWIHLRTNGSHYIYEKEDVRYPVPYHGSKEMADGLRKKIKKDMGLK